MSDILETPTLYNEHVQARRRHRLRAPGERFREAFASALTDWRLGRASQPANFSGAAAILREGMAEIIELRLRIAYTPIFRTLQRIENQLAIVAAIREDPYAPPPRTSRSSETDQSTERFSK